jgi:hypothetical protein
VDAAISRAIQGGNRILSIRATACQSPNPTQPHVEAGVDAPAATALMRLSVKTSNRFEAAIFVGDPLHPWPIDAVSAANGKVLSWNWLGLRKTAEVTYPRLCYRPGCRAGYLPENTDV